VPELFLCPRRCTHPPTHCQTDVRRDANKCDDSVTAVNDEVCIQVSAVTPGAPTIELQLPAAILIHPLQQLRHLQLGRVVQGLHEQGHAQAGSTL
jgi:hypothetical protein